MNYIEFKQAIVESEPEDWLCHSLEDFTEVYVLKKNLSITIVGAPIEFEDHERYYHDWAINQHPDPEAFEQLYTLKYNGTPIEKIQMVRVNGCRATIPVPKRNQDNSLYLANDDFRIGRIVNANLEEYNEHLKKSKISCSYITM